MSHCSRPMYVINMRKFVTDGGESCACETLAQHMLNPYHSAAASGQSPPCGICCIAVYFQQVNLIQYTLLLPLDCCFGLRCQFCRFPFRHPGYLQVLCQGYLQVLARDTCKCFARQAPPHQYNVVCARSSFQTVVETCPSRLAWVYLHSHLTCLASNSLLAADLQCQACTSTLNGSCQCVTLLIKSCCSTDVNMYQYNFSALTSILGACQFYCVFQLSVTVNDCNMQAEPFITAPTGAARHLCRYVLSLIISRMLLF